MRLPSATAVVFGCAVLLGLGGSLVVLAVWWSGFRRFRWWSGGLVGTAGLAQPPPLMLFSAISATCLDTAQGVT